MVNNRVMKKIKLVKEMRILIVDLIMHIVLYSAIVFLISINLLELI